MHAPNSYHYFGEAIDVQDWREDVLNGVHWTQRTRNLKDLLTGIGAEVFGPGDPGHDTHLHLAAKQGIFQLNACQFHVVFCGESDGRSSTFSLKEQRKKPRLPSQQCQLLNLRSADTTSIVLTT